MTVGVDITKDGDHGVLKRIVHEGEGTELPSAGCTVTVHYTGYLLDGTKFDSSKDRKEPFSFCLGKNTVIPAWEIGVATMKKKEVCMLTCAPEYAYGKNGSEPAIPPNATLRFEIEMINWELEDLSPNKNREILRKILIPGQGHDTPNEEALVTVELEGKLQESGAIFDTRTVTFNLGEGILENICEGIERAVEKMTLCEKCLLTIKPKYGFKTGGNSTLGVPPDAVLQYTVTLKTFEKAAESWQMSPGEKFVQGQGYKTKATEYFKANKYQLAIKMYTRAIYILQDIQEEFKQSVDLITSSNLNLSLVYLKVTPPHYHEARDFATKAIASDPENVKAYYRRGSAYLGLGDAELALADFQKVLQLEPNNKAGENNDRSDFFCDFATKAIASDPENVKAYYRRGSAYLGLGDAELALADFQKVLQLEPNNKAAVQQITLCRQAIQKNKQKEKVLYANMFEKFAKHDTEVEKQRASEEVDVIGEKVGEWGAEWTDQQRHRKPTDFEKENPNILLLDKEGQFQNM